MDVRETKARLLLQAAWSDKPSITQADEWVSNKSLWIKKAELFESLLGSAANLNIEEDWNTNMEAAPKDGTPVLVIAKMMDGKTIHKITHWVHEFAAQGVTISAHWCWEIDCKFTAWKPLNPPGEG